MDSQTLVNILAEIAELEELRMAAENRMAESARQADKLTGLSEEYEADARAAQAEVESEARNLRAIDRDIKQVTERIADREDHMIGVSDRRQHKALTDEITALRHRLARLEEEAMALLEREEQDLQGADQAQQESRARQQAAQEAALKKDQTREDLNDTITHIDADLARLLGMLPEGEKRHVQRLKSKLDQSVVHLYNGACQGCFHQLPVQEAINVNRGRTVVRCPSCLRYVVHRSWK